MTLQTLVRGAGGFAELVVNSKHALADLGVYFTANNGVTGVATAAAPTAYSDTAPFFTLYNSATQNTNLYPDFLRIYETAAGTAGVDLRLKLILDQQVPTAGTLITGKNVNSAASNAAVGIPRILSTCVTQTGNSRVLIGGQQVIPTQTAAITALTEVNLNFGGTEGYYTGQIGTAAAGLTRTAYDWPAVVIAPGWTMMLEFLITSQSAASSWAFELGWFEA